MNKINIVKKLAVTVIVWVGQFVTLVYQNVRGESKVASDDLM